MPVSTRSAAAYVVAVLGTALIVAAASPIRERVDPVATGFGFLVLVVACVGLGGMGPGIVASVLGFAAFNFFFLPPYETFAVAKAHDVIVLFVFLGLSVLISLLVARADTRARVAEARAEELRRQQDLSRVLVEPQRAIDRTRECCGSWWQPSASSTARCTCRKGPTEDSSSMQRPVASLERSRPPAATGSSGFR